MDLAERQQEQIPDEIGLDSGMYHRGFEAGWEATAGGQAQAPGINEFTKGTFLEFIRGYRLACLVRRAVLAR